MTTMTTPSDDVQEEPRAGGAAGSVWLAALLTAVVAGLAAFTGVTAYDVLDASSAPAAGSEELVDPDARAAVLTAATEGGQRVLSYHHDSFDSDLGAARARLTPEFREEYDSAMEQVRVNTETNRISQEATAVASSIISATADEARVLLFVNQETSSARTKGDQRVRSRLVVDLVRADRDWMVAGINALG